MNQIIENIVIPMRDGTNLELSKKKAHDIYRSYLETKYPTIIKDGIILQLDDSPEIYLERILKLFPNQDQQAYIRGLYTVTPAALFVPDALQNYAEGLDVDPKIKAIYPLELNQHIFGKGLDIQSLLYLHMNPTVSSKIVIFSNLAAFSIFKFGERKVISARQLVEQFVMDESTIEGVSFPQELSISINKLKLKIFEKLLPPNLIEQIVHDEVEKLITYDSLLLSTKSTSDTFLNISRYVGDDFDAMQFHTDILGPAQLALDNLDIHPDAGKGLMDVFDR